MDRIINVELTIRIDPDDFDGHEQLKMYLSNLIVDGPANIILDYIEIEK